MIVFFVVLLLVIALNVRMFRAMRTVTFFEALGKNKTLYVCSMLVPLAQLWVGFLLTPQFPGGHFPVWMMSPFLLNVLLGSATIVFVYKEDASLAWLIFLILYLVFTLVGNFTGIYFATGTVQNWNVPLSRLDSLFVAIGVLSTAGTGNIVPVSEQAHGYMLLQMVLDFTFVAVIISLLFARITRQRTQ